MAGLAMDGGETVRTASRCDTQVWPQKRLRHWKYRTRSVRETVSLVRTRGEVPAVGAVLADGVHSNA